MNKNWSRLKKLRQSLTCSMAILESMLVRGLPATDAQFLFALEDIVCRGNHQKVKEEGEGGGL
jgi:hypothetical protein